MAEDKKAFIFYCDWIETFKQLPKDKGYDLLMHILDYVNDEDPQTDDILIKAVFANIKNQLKRDLEKWSTIRESRSLAGKKSAEARANKKEQSSTNPTSVKSVEQSSTNPTVIDTDIVTVTGTVKANGKVDVINKKKGVDLIFDSIEFENEWNNWKEYKSKEHSFKYKSSQSEIAAQKKLKTLSGGSEQVAIKIINQSIENGWKGFFEIKPNGNNGTGSKLGDLEVKAYTDYGSLHD